MFIILKLIAERIEKVVFKISDYFNTTLYKHKNELKNKYYVKFVNEIIKDSKFIHEIPKIMGLAIFFNYILFIFTNKFFRKKLR